MKGNVDAQIIRLRRFSRLLEQMFHIVIEKDDKSIAKDVLMASVLKAKQTAKAAELVAQSGCVEEIQAMSRTLVEVTVNASYLQHTSSVEMRRYLHFHPEQAPTRGLLGSGQQKSPGLAQKIGGMLGISPSRQQQAPAFTSWSGRSLLERAQVADDASGIPVMTLLVRRCYAKGLSASMGAVASLESFLGAVRTMEAPSPEHRLAELAEALFAINLCLLTLSLYLNTALSLGLDQAINDAATAQPSSHSDVPEARYLNRAS
jgi:hypothetical protein